MERERELLMEERELLTGFVMQREKEWLIAVMIIMGLVIGVMLISGNKGINNNNQDQLVLRSIDTRHNLMSETEKYYGNQPGVTREYLLNIMIERYSNHDGRLDEIKTYHKETHIIIKHKIWIYDDLNKLLAKTEKSYTREGKFFSKTKVYYNKEGKPLFRTIWGKKKE